MKASTLRKKRAKLVKQEKKAVNFLTVNKPAFLALVHIRLKKILNYKYD